MGIINITNIELYSNHGCLEEEEKVGSNYIVNIKLKANLSKPSKTDNLEDTVDYVLIHSIVKKEMNKRAKLLEVVTQRIVDAIMKQHPIINTVWVNVAKKNPPIGGEASEVSVMLKGKRESY